MQHPEFQEELANIVEENKNSFSNTLEDCKIIFSKALDGGMTKNELLMQTQADFLGMSEIQNWIK